MPVQTLFIQSTSKVSLNSRFTQMMNKRKPSNEEFIRPTSKSERAVRYGTLLSDFHPTRDDRITAEPIQVRLETSMNKIYRFILSVTVDH